MTRVSLVSNFMSSPHPPGPLPLAPVVRQWTGTGASAQLTKNDASISTSIRSVAFNLRCGSYIAAVLQPDRALVLGADEKSKNQVARPSIDCLASDPRDLGTSDAVLGTGSLFAALDVDPTQLAKRPS